MKTTSHKNFAQFFKSLRKESRITLRDFCEKAGADPGNISRLERGALIPPRDRSILSRYAQALGVKESTDEWYLFFDLAAADRGMIPHDIMEDREVAARLPAFFRTLRGQKPTEKELRKLIEKLKEV
ncbi:MAG TPA: helix-turn-helix transcriptional regulator [Candidatus Binatia bacterium]|nr:helix-turn-helix transcriptional regulator [Candidatus Binatia bacterium]